MYSRVAVCDSESGICVFDRSWYGGSVAPCLRFGSFFADGLAGDRSEPVTRLGSWPKASSSWLAKSTLVMFIM